MQTHGAIVCPKDAMIALRNAHVLRHPRSGRLMGLACCSSSSLELLELPPAADLSAQDLASAASAAFPHHRSLRALLRSADPLTALTALALYEQLSFQFRRTAPFLPQMLARAPAPKGVGDQPQSPLLSLVRQNVPASPAASNQKNLYAEFLDHSNNCFSAPPCSAGDEADVKYLSIKELTQLPLLRHQWERLTGDILKRCWTRQVLLTETLACLLAAERSVKSPKYRRVVMSSKDLERGGSASGRRWCVNE